MSVTTGDVETFFRLRRLTCDRIDIRRDVKETSGGLVGRVDVIVAFNRLPDFEQALSLASGKLKGVEVSLRKEYSVENEVTQNSPAIGNSA